MTKTTEQENKELKERVRLYEEIMDKVLQGIYICDKHENVVWFNDVVQINDGVSREDGIGKNQNQAWKSLELSPGPTNFTLKTGEQSEEEIVTYKDKTTKKNFTVFNRSFPFYSDNDLKYVYSVAYYIGYSEKQLNKINEYKQKYLDINARIINNTTYSLYDVIGKSAIMREMVKKARKIAVNKTPVMLCGPTGTGKEIFAQGIHNASMQNKGKFVAINCAAIPENLLESILFGSVKGAFTGAIDKEGLLEEANDGTLFLDELNSMPFPLQGKLLRVFQENQACRIGNHSPYAVNCRLISATNQDPRQLVKDGILRADLYFRLAVLTLELPPLSARENDVLDLTEYFINQYNKEYNLNITKVAPQVFDLFLKYDWPGNVRELDNVIEYIMNFASFNQTKITYQDLPAYLKDFNESPVKRDHLHLLKNEKTLREILDLTEREVISGVLREANWNISKAARILGIHREALYYRIKKFDIKKP
ncbi:MAG TPA: sigma 54-interacting transcriptional regulator [Clostridiales bacterium]|nr:sigma 54-interacting transcriptional regulator [Clostridiales bacterium]